ncbi:glycosyltransferase family 4 protein [Sphingomonas donggukensis]|uniref:Glycosyltransferase family 4 protein n=1 Tax=Sphingomonas donggukensis TaxID=2949093 RepID=A0ABY4TPX3_9SPHN|nr:glycosyltransferase family 4 protein [Sphingomonas donggukensis]URW74444.1 glycosyltransferase family 4 protein [Sphingomonas donggukensis]
MSAHDTRAAPPTGLRVLHLVTDAYGGYGGIALHNRDVIESLAEEPRLAEIVSIPRIAAPFDDAVPPKVTFDTSGIAGKRAFLATVWRHLRDRRGFDAIWCGHINLAPIAWLAARWTRAPWALAIHGIDAWPRAASARARFFASRADLVVSVSQVTLDRFRSWCPVDPARCVIVHNAIHLEAYGMAPRRADLVEKYGLADRTVVLSFGRLDPTERYKGFDELIEAMPDLLRMRPDLTYLVAGRGGDLPRLQAKALALGVADQVVFTGSIEEADKADIYRLADVFALPGRGEGFGIVLLEAMACGVPAIGSSRDGSREAVRDGLIGQVVDPDDSDQLREAILTAIEQPKSVPAGLAHFSLESFGKRIRGAMARLIEA